MIKYDIDDYIRENHLYSDYKKVYWITGYKEGGAVANLVSASIISSSAIPELQNLQGTSDNVYCYTFAAPNTFYSPDNKFEERITYERNYKGEWREPKGNKYRCIFNIVNDDDFVPRLPMNECGWTKYGRITKYSIEVKDKNLLAHLQSNSNNTRYTDYRKYIAEVYKSDINKMGKLIEDFSKIFDNVENMRNDAYTYNDDDYTTFYAGFITNNSKPYQKIINKHKEVYQYQMPAYFMQRIASCMHKFLSIPFTKYDLQQAGFKFTSFATRYKVASSKLIEIADYIEIPHYLESYYALTKNVDTLDFK